MKAIKENRIKTVLRSKCFVPDSNGRCNSHYSKSSETEYYDSLGRKYMVISIDGEQEEHSFFSFDSKNRIINVTKLKKGYVIPSKRQYIDTTKIEYFYNNNQLVFIVEKQSQFRSSSTKYLYDKTDKLISKIRINKFKLYSDTFLTRYQYEGDRVKFEYSTSANTEYIYENDKSLYPTKTVTIFDATRTSTISYNKENKPIYQTQNMISDNTLTMEAIWKYNKYGIDNLIVRRQVGFGSNPLALRVEYIESFQYTLW